MLELPPHEPSGGARFWHRIFAIMTSAFVHRRRFLGQMAAGAVVGGLAGSGCGIEVEEETPAAPVELVWGVHGTRAGRLHRPRVLAIDEQDRLYIADLTDRIQVFDRAGAYLHAWRTPGLNIDGPSGLTAEPDGRVLVADTHFYRILEYSAEGNLLGQVGDGVQGTAPGRFGYPTDAIRDGEGNLFVCEYGDHDRVQVFDPAGRFLREWGGHGYNPGEFLRPRAMAFDEDYHLYVADSCNHRIQVFDRLGALVHAWGARGVGPGEMAYPYDVAIGGDGHVYVCEYGNSRVQKFTREGKPLAVWGTPGRAPGQLDNPCALAVDSQGAVHVIDSGNHRVQRFRI